MAPRFTTNKRHRSEQTTLYHLVQQHAASHIAHADANTGAELPRFVKDEFNAFLERGLLAAARGAGAAYRVAFKRRD